MNKICWHCKKEFKTATPFPHLENFCPECTAHALNAIGVNSTTGIKINIIQSIPQPPKELVSPYFPQGL